MSHLTQCNFCKYRGLEAIAKKEKAVVSKKKHPFGEFKDGVDIFVKDREGKKEWMCWLAKLGDHCEC